MKKLLLASALCALAAFAPGPASATDIDDDDDDYSVSDTYDDDDETTVVVRERVIVRRYVAPRYYRDVDVDVDVDAVYAPRRRFEHRAWAEPRVRVRHHWDD